ncbi:hypothetical protein DMN91_012079 [Ooceraea biroi]|uniref:Uncharacterized protein n=2 Tax=Ooceraea biroi TaxID=2015173 RepID=A0A026WBJ8_OOCBI|nr:hypothetical protein X777_08562 [Ooceraea biroi]RLU16319.1 hypothetical protein DMN91_012079 [Ooceraea biroi]
MIVRIVTLNMKGVIIKWGMKLNLRAKGSILCYTILCENKKTYCVPERDLRQADVPVMNTDDIIGIYFSKFKGTCYMPNEMLANEYPDDVLYLLRHMNNEL